MTAPYSNWATLDLTLRISGLSQPGDHYGKCLNEIVLQCNWLRSLKGLTQGTFLFSEPNGLCSYAVTGVSGVNTIRELINDTRTQYGLPAYSWPAWWGDTSNTNWLMGQPTLTHFRNAIGLLKTKENTTNQSVRRYIYIDESPNTYEYLFYGSEWIESEYKADGDPGENYQLDSFAFGVFTLTSNQASNPKIIIWYKDGTGDFTGLTDDPTFELSTITYSSGSAESTFNSIGFPGSPFYYYDDSTGYYYYYDSGNLFLNGLNYQFAMSRNLFFDMESHLIGSPDYGRITYEVNEFTSISPLYLWVFD